MLQKQRVALTREKHELVSWQRANTVLIFCSTIYTTKGGTILYVPVRHVYLLMPGNAARLILLGEERSVKDT